MVQIFDVIRTACGPSCQSMANCWHSGMSKVRHDPNGTDTECQNQMSHLFGSPNVIKANNPEVMVTLGEEQCILVCDLEIDNVEGDEWEISWYKMRPNGVWDPDTIKDNTRYRVTEDKLSLMIFNILYEDRGIYRCEVVNTAGKFKPSDGEFNVIVIPQDSGDGRVRIRIDQTPICCKVGDRVNMVAVIENRPKKMKLEWSKMRGLEEMQLSRRKVKISSSKVHTQAKIRSIVPEDAGVYRIKVLSPEDYAIGHIIVNVNTGNCEVEIEQMMKRAFAVMDNEGSGLLTPTQVRDTMYNLALTAPKSSIDDLIYLAVDESGTQVYYNVFIEKVIYQYKSEMA